jgi:hypothetical protein
MPDIVSVIARRWQLMVALTLAATVLAFVACLLSPKKYASTATALAANPELGDKARIFNQNIEGLYTALGSPDELDKVEGTAKLDTIYLALANDFNLAGHYEIAKTDTAALYKAAAILKKNTAINRTGYGELRIKVWDKNNAMAAALANAALQKLNDIHQRVQTENTQAVLQRLKEDYAAKRQALQHEDTLPKSRKRVNNPGADSVVAGLSSTGDVIGDLTTSAVTEQLTQYARLINEYELALKTAPKILLVVENARPSPQADKPNTLQTVLLAFVASLLFSFLFALFMESRNPKA